jgi:hypothetical protein
MQIRINRKSLGTPDGKTQRDLEVQIHDKGSGPKGPGRADCRNGGPRTLIKINQEGPKINQEEPKIDQEGPEINPRLG